MPKNSEQIIWQCGGGSLPSLFQSSNDDKFSWYCEVFVHAVYTFHKMPDLDFVTIELSEGLRQLYTKAKRINADLNTDDKDIDLPRH